MRPVFNVRDGTLILASAYDDDLILSDSTTTTPGGTVVKTEKAILSFESIQNLKKFFDEEYATFVREHLSRKIANHRIQLDLLTKEYEAAVKKGDEDGEAETDGEEPEGATDDPEAGGT